MDNLNNKPCGIPRTIEEQICDLQYQLNRLKMQLASGEFGSPLECSLVTTSNSLPSIWESNPLSIPFGDFNRTPNVGESFRTEWEYTTAENDRLNTYSVTWEVKSVATDAAYCTVSGYVSILGEQGEMGNGISSVYSVGYRVENNQTITKIDVAYTDPDKQTETFEVYANNGKPLYFNTIYSSAGVSFHLHIVSTVNATIYNQIKAFLQGIGANILGNSYNVNDKIYPATGYMQQGLNNIAIIGVGINNDVIYFVTTDSQYISTNGLILTVASTQLEPIIEP